MCLGSAGVRRRQQSGVQRVRAVAAQFPRAEASCSHQGRGGKVRDKQQVEMASIMRMSTHFVSESKLNINFGISCEVYIVRCDEDVTILVSNSHDVCWNVTLCSQLESFRRFGGTYC